MASRCTFGKGLISIMVDARRDLTNIGHSDEDAKIYFLQ